jgi:Spy/CpxP family protein refolding chaperone
MPLFYAGAILAVAVLPVVVGYIDYKLISHYEYKLSWRQTRDAYDMNQKINQMYEKLIPEQERKL